MKPRDLWLKATRAAITAAQTPGPLTMDDLEVAARARGFSVEQVGAHIRVTRHREPISTLVASTTDAAVWMASHP